MIVDVSLHGFSSPKAGQLSFAVVYLKEGQDSVIKTKIASVTSLPLQKNETVAKTVSLCITRLFSITKSPKFALLVISFRPWDFKSLTLGSSFDAIDLKHLTESFFMKAENVKCPRNLQLSMIDLSSLFHLRTFCRRSRHVLMTKVDLIERLYPLSLTKPQEIILTSYQKSLSSVTLRSKLHDPSDLLAEISIVLSCGDHFNETEASGDLSFESKNSSGFDTQLIQAIEANEPPAKYCSEYPYLYYHYLFSLGEEDLSKMEIREKLSCCFCKYIFDSGQDGYITLEDDTKLGLAPVTIIGLETLSHHLLTYHSHFSYSFFMDQYKNIHITLSKNSSTETNNVTDREEISHIRPRKRFRNGSSSSNRLSSLTISKVNILTYSQILRKNRLRPGFFGFEEPQSSPVNPVKVSKTKRRQYFHARTGLPLMESELETDSEDDIDIASMTAHNNRMLDEFEDVSYEEKEFMKLWNSYIIRNPVVSVAFLSLSIQSFLDTFSREILERKLRYQFLLHVINLWDNGLLKLGDVEMLLLKLDEEFNKVSNSRRNDSALIG